MNVPKRKVKFKLGDRVILDNNYPALVLAHDRRGVRIRNVYGFIETVASKRLRREE